MALGEALAASKLKLLLAGVVVVGGAGATAVATDTISLGGGGGDVVDGVPEGVDVVMYADPAVAQDQTTADLMNGLIDISQENNPFYTGPDSYEEVLENGTAEADLDPTALNGVAMYGSYPNETDGTAAGGLGESSFGVLVDSNWGEQEFVDSFNDTEFEQREYEGYTVYVERQTEDEDRPEYLQRQDPPTWVGVLADGQYVTGTEAAVKDAIDVDRGATDTFGGDLRSEYDATRDGYLRFAAAVPQERIPDRGMAGSQQFGAVRNVQYVSGAYYTEGDSIGMEARLTTADGNQAEDLASITDGGIATAKQFTRSNETAALLDQVTVEQDGSTVVVTFQSPVADILDAVEAGYEERGFGESTGSTRTTAASE